MAFLRRIAAVFLLLCAAAALRAQAPADNLAWKDRCIMLAALYKPIQTGRVPVMLVAAVHGIPAQQYVTFGFNRSRSGDHAVACTLFFMAAISGCADKDGKANHATRNAALLGLDESRLARGRRLTLSQRIARESIKLHQISAAPLTAAQLQAVLAASDTMPISTGPPPKLP